MKLILLAHVFATLFMVGLIWFVQIVHYPLYSSVGREHFPQHEALHSRLTTWVVGPAMLVEMVTTVAMLRYPPNNSALLVSIGLALLAIIWLSTATLSVPAHNALTVEYSTTAYRKLVSTNWIRTVGWSMRGLSVMVMTYRNLCV